MRTYAGVVLAGSDEMLAVQIRDDRPGIANRGLVTTFGGLAEGPESPSAAAVRELREELAISVDPAQLRELLRREKRDASGATLCVLYRLAVPDVHDLDVREGTGALVGTAEQLLRDARLTQTCRVAVRAAGSIRP